MSADVPIQCFRKSPEQVLLEREAMTCKKCIFVRQISHIRICALTERFALYRCKDYEERL